MLIDPLGLEAFLQVSRTRNISRASELLNATQSTVSKRIKQLEQNIGSQLFIRGKGQKNIELTEAGERLFPIAEHWLVLCADMKNISTRRATQYISIGILESITQVLLIPFFDALYTKAPEIKLRIVTHPSIEMYNHVEMRNVDVGFTLRQRVNPYVDAHKLFSEKLVIMRPGKKKKMYRLDSLEVMPFKDLNPDNELFIVWSEAYQLWHELHWKHNNSRRITLNNPSLLVSLLRKPEQWAIVPYSIANYACQHGSFELFDLEDTPPERTCYVLLHKQPRHSSREPIKTLEKHLERITREKLPWAELYPLNLLR